MLAATLLGLGGCDCAQRELVPGDYGAPEVRDLQISDYRLTISADKTRVVETFTRDGRRYTVRYRAASPR